MMFPEDLRGHFPGCRGAGFMCQLGQAEIRRPVGILTNIEGLFDKLYKEWPCLIRHIEDLQYRGPLPNHCPCVPSHQNLRGVDAADHFISASSHTLGERFWSWIFENFSANYNRPTLKMATRLRRFSRLPQVCHHYSQFLCFEPGFF